MIYGDNTRYWAFLQPWNFPYNPKIPSDFNLGAFLAWVPTASRRQQYEVRRARLPLILHRRGETPEEDTNPVQVRTVFGTVELGHVACKDVGCERCGARGGYKWPWGGPWVCRRCLSPAASDSADHSRREWLACNDPDCAGHGGLPRRL